MTHWTTKNCSSLRVKQLPYPLNPDAAALGSNYKKRRKILKSVQKQRNYALNKNAKIVMLRMDVWTSRY